MLSSTGRVSIDASNFHRVSVQISLRNWCVRIESFSSHHKSTSLRMTRESINHPTCRLCCKTFRWIDICWVHVHQWKDVDNRSWKSFLLVKFPYFFITIWRISRLALFFAFTHLYMNRIKTFSLNIELFQAEKIVWNSFLSMSDVSRNSAHLVGQHLPASIIGLQPSSS